MSQFRPGTLQQRVIETSAQALRSGALEPIPTAFEFLEDAGIRFLVRVIQRLARKPRAAVAPAAGPSRNPFLPYDPALYVADAGSTHVCLLNKFNVVEHHLLIVTREFQHQEVPLTQADFATWWLCLVEYDSLGFYNSGTAAGASQPHKHLQLVPLPLAAGGPRIPLEPLLAWDDGTARLNPSPALPFQHANARLALDPYEPADAARHLHQHYETLLALTGLSRTLVADGRLNGAYNLLLTRQWMLLVPRRAEHFGPISLNALAFAGALLTRNDEQKELLRQAGPMRALQHVATARSPERCAARGIF